MIAPLTLKLPASLLRSGSKVGPWSHLVQCDRVLDDRVQMMLQVGPFGLGHMRDPEVHIGVSARFGHDGRLLPSCLHDPHHHRETAPPRSARDLPTSNGWKQQCTRLESTVAIPGRGICSQPWSLLV